MPLPHFQHYDPAYAVVSNFDIELDKLFDLMGLDTNHKEFTNMNNSERIEYVRDVKLNLILK